jgi:hypothetical protein
MTLLFFSAYLIAITLTVFSVWRISRFAYCSILVSFAVGLIIGELRNGASGIDLLAIMFDVLLFGFIFYYVTVQWLMDRKASDVTSREAYREAMEDKGIFFGFRKFVYYLPVPLFILGILLALVGAYLQK